MGVHPLLLALPFANLDKASPWYEFRDLFVGRLTQTYINVVFGLHPIPKVNILTGLRRMQSLTDQRRGLPPENDLEEPGEVPNFVRLYTPGITNVAMVGTAPRALLDVEIGVLHSYNAVFVPTHQALRTFIDEGTDLYLEVATPGVFAHYLRLKCSPSLL